MRRRAWIKPRSSIWSASSSTRYWVCDRSTAARSIRSISRPGVATSRSVPRSKRLIWALIDTPPKTIPTLMWDPCVYCHKLSLIDWPAHVWARGSDPHGLWRWLCQPSTEHGSSAGQRLRFCPSQLGEPHDIATFKKGIAWLDRCFGNALFLQGIDQRGFSPSVSKSILDRSFRRPHARPMRSHAQCLRGHG